MSSKPWYAKGLQFECTQCGNCCKNHGDYSYVYVVDAEIDALAEHLDLSRRTFLKRYCVRDDGYWTLRMDEPACPFLSDEGTCEVYPVRPKQCATWPFWQENLKRETWDGPVRECCPGIGQGRRYSREEIERTARETEEWYDA